MALFSTQPESINAYQTRTHEKKVSMANCTFRTFMCKKCKKQKSIHGRKSLGWKAGFNCAECCK